MSVIKESSRKHLRIQWRRLRKLIHNSGAVHDLFRDYPMLFPGLFHFRDHHGCQCKERHGVWDDHELVEHI